MNITLRWHILTVLLYTNEYYLKVTHSYCVVKYEWILQIVNTKLYSGKMKATCCGWTYWLSSGLITRIQEGVHFTTVFQVRGLNCQKLQYTYSVEDIGCLKFITCSLGPTVYILFYTLMIRLKYPHITSKKCISNCYIMLFFLS